MADAHPNPPMRVFCPKHDEFYATYTIGRPLLDDRCPACLIESLQSRERRLREYAQHKPHCDKLKSMPMAVNMVYTTQDFITWLSQQPCTCGLSALLSEDAPAAPRDEVERIKCATCGHEMLAVVAAAHRCHP